jgi:hypothetical protein
LGACEFKSQAPPKINQQLDPATTGNPTGGEGQAAGRKATQQPQMKYQRIARIHKPLNPMGENPTYQNSIDSMDII